MKEFEELQDLLRAADNSTFYTNTPVRPERWWQGYVCLACLLFVTVCGLPSGHAPALAILSLPVLVFVNEGFQQTSDNANDEEEKNATRKCALEAFAKGLLLGPPILALAEAVLGLLLAVICFGQQEVEQIVREVTQQPSAFAGTLSTRLYREAALQDPVGACVFALFSSMLVAGVCEEGFKMGIGAWQMLRYRQYKRTLQPNMVMAGAGLGLAYSESVLAICTLTLSPRSIALVAAERVLTCFPIHVFCAVWTARRASTRKHEQSWFQALLPSAITHGLYDFGLILCSNYASSRFVGLGWGLCSALATSAAGLRA